MGGNGEDGGCCCSGYIKLQQPPNVGQQVHSPHTHSYYYQFHHSSLLLGIIDPSYTPSVYFSYFIVVLLAGKLLAEKKVNKQLSLPSKFVGFYCCNIDRKNQKQQEQKLHCIFILLGKMKMGRGRRAKINRRRTILKSLMEYPLCGSSFFVLRCVADRKKIEFDKEITVRLRIIQSIILIRMESNNINVGHAEWP